MAIDQHLKDLRSRISDLGHELDARKASIARSVGGAVLLLMIAGGAAYDVITRNGALLVRFSITRETLTLISIGCALGGLILIGHAIVRSRFGDQSRDVELAKLEQEYAGLLERQDTTSKAD